MSWLSKTVKNVTGVSLTDVTKAGLAYATGGASLALTGVAPTVLPQTQAQAIAAGVATPAMFAAPAAPVSVSGGGGGGGGGGGIDTTTLLIVAVVGLGALLLLKGKR